MKNFYFTAKILLLSLAFFSLQAQAQNCSAPAEPYVNWSQCDKTFADLYYANLFAADLSGASLQYANLSGASLQFANLTEANLTEANLTNVFLNYANLTQVNLTQVNLYGANLYGANLESAQLNQANLSGANLTNASLTNANLTGVTSGGITGTPTALPTGWVLANGYLIGSGANLNFCAGAKVAAAGSGLKFYTALTGGSPLAETTALATKTYYVTVTDASEGDRVLVTVTVNALPATPTLLVLTNEAPVYPATPDTAIKAVGVYVGAEAALKLTATAVGATSYVWTLPAGVTLADGFTTGTVTTQLNTINVKFSASAATSSLIVSVKSVNASGCSSLAKTLTLTRAIPVAPAYLKMNNGLDTTAITSFAMYMGWDAILRLTAAASATATSYVWELPEGVNRVTGIYDYNPIYSNESTVPEIFVTLSGVTSGNTHNYLTSAAVPVSTNVLRIGVKSKNGVGISETSNATLANSSSEFYPNAYSKAKLLTLTAVKPAAPATLKMYDLAVSATAAVTDITKYVNTETELTLTAAASTRAFANYYRWELPAGVTVTYDSDGNVPAYNIGGNFYESISNEITIKFNNYYQNPASSLVLGVRVVNGIGESVSTNAAPNASRTDKLLTLKAVLPSVAGTVTGSLKICATTASSVTYTIAALAAKALDYEIEAPEGCTITMVHPIYGPYTSYDNYAGTQAVANASFTVNYPAGFIANTTTDVKTITIRSYNYVGPSATAKVLTLTNVGAISCPTAPAAPATLKMYDLNSLTPATAVTDITKYVNTETELTLTAAASAFANYYRWELPAGVSVTNNSAYNIGGNFYESTSNGITIKFNNYYQYPASSLVLGVRAVNGLGESVSTNAAPNASRTDKLLTLTASLPTVPGTVSGSLKICATTASSVTYTIAALAAKALDYDIEAPQGCTITVVDPIYGPNTSYDNFLNIPAVANFSFTVNYPAGFIANTTTDAKTITIRSYNNVGPSATAKVLPLTNVGAVSCPTAPAAPATFVLQDMATATPTTPAPALTDITKYVNTQTELTLTAATSAFASYYVWALPTGVSVTNNSATYLYDPNTGLVYYESTSNVITVNFYGVPHEPEAFSLVLGVRAVNGIGESLSTNAAPNALRTDKLLTLTAVLPTVPGTVSGSLKICATTASNVTYTIAAVAKNARNYEIYAPQGCTITVVDPIYGPYTSYDNIFGMPAVANASFTVNYPAGFIANTTTDVKTITIRSLSYVGPSATAKVLPLTNVGAVCTPAPGKIAAEATTADKFSAVAYPNPATEGFRVKSSNGKSIGVQVYDMLGRSIEQRQLQSEDQIGSNYAKGIYNVIVSQGTEVKTLRVIKQ